MDEATALAPRAQQRYPANDTAALGYVPDQLRQQIASQLGGLLWTRPENSDDDDGTTGAGTPRPNRVN